MKAKKKYKGMVRYAKHGIKCRSCGKWLKVGERKANQFLCCNDNDARILTECQKKHYKAKRDRIADNKPVADYGFVFCDVCGTKVKRRDPMQKRCVGKEKGELSQCQKKAMRKTSAKHYDDPLITPPVPETKKRTCLKCGEKFDSLHVHNRICEKCAGINEKAERPQHKILIEGDLHITRHGFGLVEI